MLLPLYSLQSTWLCWCGAGSWDNLLCTRIPGHFPAEISLWTEFHWTVLGICKASLPSKPSILSRRSAREECCGSCRGSAIDLDVKICSLISMIHGCVWKRFKQPASGMGSVEIQRASRSTSRNHDGTGKKGYRLNPPYCPSLFPCHAMFILLISLSDPVLL